MIWKRKYGKDRVFCSSLGQQAEEFDVLQPEALTGRPDARTDLELFGSRERITTHQIVLLTREAP